MATQKRVFVAFAIEDERQRNLLSGQKLHPKCPFEFIDLSVKEAYDSDWKTKVRTRIKGCDGVIALVSKNSKNSTGQAWEISCAKEEKKKILGVRAYSDDHSTIDGIRTVAWSWDGIADFIDGL
jgi:antiphage defense system Thoeris ThsB-like protein